jgi:hypothetical protein
MSHRCQSRSSPPFAERALWNFRLAAGYSGLMPAALITLPHFSVSSAMSLLNSAGVIGIGALRLCTITRSCTKSQEAAQKPKNLGGSFTSPVSRIINRYG